MFKIEINDTNNQKKILFVYGEKTILSELEYHNISINHSCRNGHCGLCAVSLISGDVEYRQKNLVPLVNKEILACCAKPISDIKINLNN